MIALLGVLGLGLAILLASALAGGVVETVTGSQDKGVLAFVSLYLGLIAASAVLF